MMYRHPIPVIGTWYRESGEAEIFQVIAVDKSERTVEVQQFDGALREIDFYEWFSMPLRPVAQPEDLSGVFDTPDIEDSCEEACEWWAQHLDENHRSLDQASLQHWREDYDS